MREQETAILETSSHSSPTSHFSDRAESKGAGTNRVTVPAWPLA